MKRLLLSALLAVLLCIPWTQAQTTPPFDDNFEGTTSNWTFVNGTLTNQWCIGSATNHGGSKAMYISNDGGTSNAYTNNSSTMVYAYKEFTLAAGQYEISYDWQCYGESNYDFIRVVLTPSTETFTAGTSLPSGLTYSAVPSTWTALDGGTKLNLVSSWQSYAGDFTVTTAGTYKIVFCWRNDGSTGSQPPAAVDNFHIAALTCPKPTALTSANVTDATADISWTAGASETSWEYVYGVAGFTPDWTNATTASTPSATLAGLNSNTSYTIYVRSACSATDKSMAASYTFRTACAAVNPASLGVISFETSEGFTAYTYASSSNALMGNCWTEGNLKSTSYSYRPFVYTSSTSSYAHTGSNCLQIKAYKTSSTNADSAYAVMPEFTYTGSIASYEAHFYMRKTTTSASSSYNDTLWVGIVSDPEDLSDLQIVGYGVNTTTTYAQQIVTFGSYTGGTTGYIVFLATVDLNASSNYKYGSFYVDDVEIVKGRATTTPVIDSVFNITATTAQVAFSGSNATSYRIMAATEAVADPENYTNWALDTTGITASPATVNLQPATKYYLYVQGFGSDTSFASTSVMFRTECLPVAPASLGTISFETSEGFESGPGNMTNCWTVGNMQSTSTSYIPYAYNSTTYSHTGSNCLRLYANTSSYNQADSAYAVMPEMTYNGSIASYEAHFYMRKANTSTTSSYNDTLWVGIVQDPSDLSDLQIVGYGLNTTTSYAQQIVTFSNYTGGTTGYIVFLAKVDQNASASYKYAGFYVDDLEIIKGRATHTPVVDSVFNITTTTADVAFSGNATSYRIMAATEVVANPDTFNNWAIDTVVTASPATINVQHSTKYYLYVQGYGTDTSFISNPVTQFRSECGAAAIPYTCGFEASEGFTSSSTWVDGVLEERCWSTLGMKPSGANYPYYRIATDYIHSGSQGLKGFVGPNGYGYWILPEFAVSTDSLVMELWYRTEGTNDNSPYVEIGYMSDPTDSTTFVMLQQLARTTTMTKASQAFQNLSVPSTARIAVRFGGGTGTNYYCGIDDIKIIKCRATTTPVIDSVYNITTTTAQVAFSGSNATSYRIMAATENVANPDTFTSWAIDTVVTASPTTINVQPSTKYYLYIQGIGADTSLISNPAQFRSECAAFAIPFVCGFEPSEGFTASSSWVDGALEEKCWSTLGMKPEGEVYPYYYITNSTYLHSGSQGLKGISDGSGVYGYWILPEFAVPTNSLSMELWYRNEGTYSSSPYVEIGYMTDPTDSTTFVMLQQLAKTTTMTLATQSFAGPNVPSTARIAIRFGGATSNGYFCGIDDIRVINPYDSVSVVATAQVSNTGTVEGSGNYLRGTSVTLTATPAEHYHFVQWVEDGVTTATRTITASADTTYFTAQFAADSFNITGLSADTVMGTVSGSGRFPYNYTAQLTATANYGYHFTGWSNGDNTASTFITVTGDSTITANFAPDTFAVTLNVNDASMGTVTGAGNYVYNTTATLIAVPNAGHHFVNWSNGETNDTITVTVTAATTLTATFAVDSFNITVLSSDTVMGTVTGAGRYPLNYTAQLTATANYGYHFTGWSNGDTTATTFVTVTNDATITANFAKNQYTVTLTANPSNGGVLTGAGTYNYLDTVTVIATPDTNYRLDNWSNGATDDTLTFVITCDTALTANFVVNQNVITVYYDSNLGTVTGAGWYPYGTVVDVTATPKPYAHFLGWAHDIETAATGTLPIFDTASTLTITLTDDIYLTAYFACDTSTVTAVADPADGGTVTGGGEYQNGSYATLTATPADGYEFTGWSNGDTAATIIFMVTSDTTFTASFKKKGTAVDNVEAAQYVAYTEGRRIVVTGVEGHTVSVFDATGRLVATRTNAEDTETFDTPLAGVYMIKVNGMNTTAIVVK